MKKIKLTKLIASLIIIGSVFTLNPIAASAEWKQDNSGWWYADGSTWVTGWKLLDGKWYYFDSNGYMAKNTVIDGCNLGADGAWIQNAIIATVGSENIMEDDLNKIMSSYDAQLKEKYGADYASNSNYKPMIKKIKKQQLDKLIAEKILLKKAVELNLKPAENDITKLINDEMNKVKAQYSGQYDTFLKQNGINENQFKELLSNSIIEKAVQDEIVKNVTTTDDEVNMYYDKNKETTFTKGAGATVSHILVADEQTAKDLKAKLDAGADFAALAKANSTDPGSKNNGGSLGFVEYNTTQLVTEFVDGFKDLKEGQVSNPVKSQFGYHLIKATGLKTGDVIPFDQVKDKLKEAILQEKKKVAYNAKMQEWEKALNVKTYEDKL